MATHEARKLVLRSLGKRSAESVLLVVGIALGIGTTAGGLSTAARLRRSADELVRSPQYREIVVSTRDSATDMAVPAYRNEADETVVLTGEDLSAREAAPDVEYAYVASKRRVRVNNFDAFRPATPADAPRYEGPPPALERIDAVQVTPEFFSAYGMAPSAGGLFTLREIEAGRPVAVVGAELSKILFDDGVSLGREILIGRTLYEIIGVAEATGTTYDHALFYPSITAAVSAESAAVARFRGLGAVLRFTVYEAGRLDEARAQLQSYFESTYGAGAVVVRTPGVEAREAIDRNSRLVSIILFLAISGLLIAAVNASNILYGRAMRKRKTVGVLKAIGARRIDVFNLFLSEALIIGVTGAGLGVGVSIVFTRLLGATYSPESLVTGSTIAGAFGGLVVTLALTVVPALQASAIPAAEALRYE